MAGADRNVGERKVGDKHGKEGEDLEWHVKRLELYSFFFLLCRAALVAYGSSQARGRIRAVATSLRQSRSNAGSEPRL